MGAYLVELVVVKEQRALLRFDVALLRDLCFRGKCGL